MTGGPLVTDPLLSAGLSMPLRVHHLSYWVQALTSAYTPWTCGDLHGGCVTGTVDADD